MTASSQKETKCIFRIEEDLLKKYKSICEKNGYDMSKKLRLFIEEEVNTHSNNKCIEEELVNYMQSNLFEFFDEDKFKKDLGNILNKFITKGDIYRYDIKIEEKLEDRIVINLMIESIRAKPHILYLSIIKTGNIISGGF